MTEKSNPFNDLLKTRVESHASNINSLRTEVGALVKIYEKSLSGKCGDVGNSIRSVATSENYKKLSGSLDGISDLLLNQKKDLDDILKQRNLDTVINKLNLMEELCVNPMRQIIKDNEKCLKEMRAASEAYDKAINGSKVQKPEVITKLDAQLVDAKKKTSNSEAALEDNIKKFETQRITDIRDVLVEYLTNNIYYHAKSLEYYTKAHDLIVNISPEEGRASLATELDKLAIAVVGDTKK